MENKIHISYILLKIFEKGIVDACQRVPFMLSSLGVTLIHVHRIGIHISAVIEMHNWKFYSHLNHFKRSKYSDYNNIFGRYKTNWKSEGVQDQPE